MHLAAVNSNASLSEPLARFFRASTAFSLANQAEGKALASLPRQSTQCPRQWLLLGSPASFANRDSPFWSDECHVIG